MENGILKRLTGTVEAITSMDHELLQKIKINGVDYVNISRKDKQDWSLGDRVTFSAGMRYMPDKNSSCLNAWHVQKVIPKVYMMPDGSIFDNWRGYEAYGFIPDSRQEFLMEAARYALAEGLHYNKDVYKHVVKQLAIDQELLSIDIGKIEHGKVGTDIYCARHAVEAAKKWVLIQQAHDKLKPVEGMAIGTLNVGYKKTTKCLITKVRGLTLYLSAKRGRSEVSFSCDSKQLIAASVGAFDKGWRTAPLCANYSST